MSGWKSTKDGKHFKTKSKPGINSNDNNKKNNNNSSTNSGTQPSPHNSLLPTLGMCARTKELLLKDPTKHPIGPVIFADTTPFMQTERKKIDRLKNQIKITQTAYDVVKAHEKKNFLKGNPDRKLYGPDVVPHFSGSIKLGNNLFDRKRELLDAEADMRYAKAQQKRSSN